MMLPPALFWQRAHGCAASAKMLSYIVPFGLSGADVTAPWFWPPLEFVLLCGAWCCWCVDDERTLIHPLLNAAQEAGCGCLAVRRLLAVVVAVLTTRT